jgi:hypothetical protein
VSGKYTIGPDVDLDREDVRLADGTRLTPAIAEEMADSALREVRAGRPSLTGRGGRSPQVSFRLPPSMRDAAEQQARREGKKRLPARPRRARALPRPPLSLTSTRHAAPLAGPAR